MGRVDCSLTLNYVKERGRMCNSMHGCDDCPLVETLDCALVSETSQECIDIVQKWSDEHPQETMAEHFFNLFPNAPKSIDGISYTCPNFLGWVAVCPKSIEQKISCEECWNRPYIEVQNENL